MASSNNAAIWSAAAKAGPQASAVLQSLDKSGYNYGQVITNDWYAKYVPEDVKSDVAGYNRAWESVFVGAMVTGVDGSTTSASTASTGAPTATGTATATSSVSTAAAAAGLVARCTGVAVAAAAGAVGVVMAVM